MINNHGYEHQGNPWTLIPSQVLGRYLPSPEYSGGLFD
jgi:hypothetical protein